MNILLSAFMSLLIFGNTVRAATPTAAPTISATRDDSTESAQPLENLKDRLATTVAQLHQTQLKAVVGDIKTVSVSTVTISTKTSDIKLELTDDLKIFQNIRGKRTELTTDNLEKDDHVVVFGDYDSTIDLLKAQVIIIQSPLPSRVSGTITDVNKKDYTVTLITPEGQTYIIDIETNSSMLAYDPEKGIVKGGFSKLVDGDTVHIVGTPNTKEENRMSALRFLDIGNLNPVTPTPAETATASASAKGTPTVTEKVSPTP
jgi:hypothetical protein